jgi:hypothetical protein
MAGWFILRGSRVSSAWLTRYIDMQQVSRNEDRPRDKWRGDRVGIHGTWRRITGRCEVFLFGTKYNLTILTVLEKYLLQVNPVV